MSSSPKTRPREADVSDEPDAKRTRLEGSEDAAGDVAMSTDPAVAVVNIADLLARWTNNVFVSTVHRVINTNDTVRYSMPAFFGVNLRTLVEVFPICPSKHLDYAPRRFFNGSNRTS